MNAQLSTGHPELAHLAESMEQLRWTGFLLDHEFRLVWASPDLERFLGFPPEEEIGYGLHVLEAFNRDAWCRVTSSESGAG